MKKHCTYFAVIKKAVPINDTAYEINNTEIKQNVPS